MSPIDNVEATLSLDVQATALLVSLTNDTLNMFPSDHVAAFLREKKIVVVR